jgi:hypothetical protein
VNIVSNTAFSLIHPCSNPKFLNTAAQFIHIEFQKRWYNEHQVWVSCIHNKDLPLCYRQMVFPEDLGSSVLGRKIQAEHVDGVR